MCIIHAISIHAPQWGATIDSIQMLPGYDDFNPRTPVGCDIQGSAVHGAIAYFNPRTPVGCDHEVFL